MIPKFVFLHVYFQVDLSAYKNVTVFLAPSVVSPSAVPKSFNKMQ